MLIGASQSSCSSRSPGPGDKRRGKAGHEGRIGAASRFLAFILRSMFAALHRPTNAESNRRMNPIRLPNLVAACMIVLLGEAAAQPIPPANIPSGAPPGVYVPPPPPGQPGTTNSACVRLESELARIDTGSAGPDSARRYDDAIARQRFELDQTTAQITRMRSNLDRMISEMNQSRGGGMDLNRDLQRRQIIAALQQNNCGSQYRNASPLDLPSSLNSSTFKTLCVRTCDGYYFPVSYATVTARFGEDEQACRRL